MRRLAAVAVTTAFLAVACADTSGPTGSTTNRREIVVAAAASLTDAFTDIGTAFERLNAGATVTFDFGPSDGLAAQIDGGAPVDVFASASPSWVASVGSEGPGVTDRTAFARNKLAIVVPPDNPADIRSPSDLGNDGVKLVLAAEGVPAGDYAREMLARAGVAKEALANVVSNEADVRGVLAKVLSGDADAGVTYVTDVTPDVAGSVDIVRIPPDENVIATYEIAVVSGSDESDLARQFVDYVTSDGEKTLRHFGFLSA